MTEVYAIVKWRTHETVTICATPEIAVEVLNSADFNRDFNEGRKPMDFFPPYDMIPMRVAESFAEALLFCRRND